MTNVVFDVGKVLLRWEPFALLDALIGEDEAKRADFRESVDFIAFHTEHDRGRPIAAQAAVAAEHYPDHAGVLMAFYDRWLDSIPGPIEGSVAILERLHAADVPLFAITNFAAEQWDKTVPAYPFLTRFRDVVVSGREGLLKPDPAIYRLLFERNDLAAGDCVFIDDNPDNVAAASGLGMDAHLFERPDRLAEWLAERGLPV
ncbi:MAG: HAD family hydrolase [Paracoccaceae bacterium]